MPTDQVPNSAGKSTLVRSKSLRLPTNKTKPEQTASSSTLSRHGSIRVPKNQSVLPNSNKPQLSVFRKPFIKPKPAFISSKSTENLTKNNYEDARRNPCRSPTKNLDNKAVTFLQDGHPTPSESPTSMQSDKSHSNDASSSWCSSDLAVHLKRLTEEHEKLQVEYARLRMQMLESNSFQPSSLRRDLQHLSHSDSQLSSIPENSPDANSSLSNQQQISQSHEAVVQSYRHEIVRLQEENRKLQRKYWEQILNSELIEDETCNGASQQVVDLIDKLDEKEKELLDATGRVQELENHLAATTLELQQCQDALQDQQHMLEDVSNQKEDLARYLRKSKTSLKEARENNDFLQMECSTLAEALQEVEQSLTLAKNEQQNDQCRLNELMDKARKLYGKVKEKNLQIQLLTAELARTEGSCRDMLLSQGAELTMTSMHLSQMSILIHTMLTAVADFAAKELELQKEMLEEVMADLDSEGERSDSPPKENGISLSSTQIPDAVEQSPANSEQKEVFVDMHKSLPDISACQPSPLCSPSSSGSDRPTSLVQLMVKAFEKTSDSDPRVSISTAHKSAEANTDNSSDSVKSSIENLSSIHSDLSLVSSPGKEGHASNKPIGMATAFRPMSVESESAIKEQNSTDDRKSSLETQLSQMSYLIKKVGKVIELMQGKFMAKIKLICDEKVVLQEELHCSKKKQYQLQTEMNIKNDIMENTNEKLDETSLHLKNSKKEFIEEKELLLKKVESLQGKIVCLEALNSELSQQLQTEVHKMIEIGLNADSSNSEYLSNAQAICDKLDLKQEIAKLKATVSQKEQLLQQFAQKYSRTKGSLEGNLQKAEKEIEFLDSVIGKVSSILQNNQELVESNESLKSLKSLVSGNCTITNFKHLISKVEASE